MNAHVVLEESGEAEVDEESARAAVAILISSRLSARTPEALRVVAADAARALADVAPPRLGGVLRDRCCTGARADWAPPDRGRPHARGAARQPHAM